MKTRIVAVPPLVLVLVFVLVLVLTVSDAAEYGPTDEVASAEHDADNSAEKATTSTVAVVEGRGHMKNMMMNPYMLIPQLIALGFAPIVLANLKMLVMSALMINNMALNAAIFMTVRNMVFGPRPTVKYVNYGYRDQQHSSYHHHDGGGDHHYSRQSPQQQQQQQPSHASADGIETIGRRKRTVVVS